MEKSKFRADEKIDDFKKSRNFHDPWVGTDTTGPGEAVSAIGGANLEGIT